MSDLIQLYNPQNARALSSKEIEAMQHFSNEQIEELAKAYPNQPRGNNYLVLINTQLPANEQVYQLSTWQNLAALRRLNQGHFSAYSFNTVFNNKDTPKVGVSLPAKVVDLSSADLSQAQGFKPSDVRTDPAITTVGTAPAKLVPTEDIIKAPVEYDLSNPDVISALNELNIQKSKLQTLNDEKAHHMTIKAQQTKVDEVQVLLDALVKK